MDEKMKWLKRYSETCGVSGFEGRIKDLLIERLDQKAEVSYDKLGSVVFTAAGAKKEPKIMLASHKALMNLFSTHPSTESRIEKLKELARRIDKI